MFQSAERIFDTHVAFKQSSQFERSEVAGNREHERGTKGKGRSFSARRRIISSRFRCVMSVIAGATWLILGALLANGQAR